MDTLNKLFYISEKDWNELQGWATIAYEEDKNEISGLMTAVPQKDGRYKISDVEILKQENSGTNTTLDGDSVAAYKMKYAMKHKNKGMKYVWWHSHHTMGAFWSGTDENEINAWENESFSLALVINLKEEYKFRVSIWKAVGLPIAQHYDIPLTIEKKNKIKITDKMKTLYEELCEDEVRHVVHQSGFNYQGRIINNYKREESLNVEKAYEETLAKLDNINDEFMEDSISVGEWRKKIKDMNKILKKKKVPFSVKIADDIKGNKQRVINMLMVTTSDDMLDWRDYTMKARCEQSYLWGGAYGY